MAWLPNCSYCGTKVLNDFECSVCREVLSRRAEAGESLDSESIREESIELQHNREMNRLEEEIEDIKRFNRENSDPNKCNLDIVVG